MSIFRAFSPPPRVLLYASTKVCRKVSVLCFAAWVRVVWGMVTTFSGELSGMVFIFFVYLAKLVIIRRNRFVVVLRLLVFRRFLFVECASCCLWV